MIEVYSVLFLPIFVSVFLQNVNNTHAAELISTYSKVARWGPNNTINSVNEARSNTQTFWPQRTDASLKKLELSKQPTYYYSMKSSSKIDNDNIDTVPSKGEVEERFNPRPYFDFVFEDPPKQNKPNPQSTPKKPSETKSPTIVYGAPVNFPVPKLPVDLYSSPFSSYNPPDQNPDDSKDDQADTLNFPPNNNKPSITVQTTSKRPEKKPPSTSYGVPDSQVSKPIPDSDNMPNYNQYLPPIVENAKKPATKFRPPLVPTKKPSKPYFIDDSDDHISDTYPQPMSDYESPMMQTPMSDYESPMMQTPMPPSLPKPMFLEHPPKNHPPSMPSMAEEDLSPPPEDIAYGKFPHYVDHDPHDHGFYHFHHDHDVYHEVHSSTAATTTSTEAPRAGHYSYYYLGRKLWYIPLYFSVYFIVYVTVLILKSIARHKIQFTQYFDKSRSARQLDVDVLNQTVITAIEESRNKYM